MDRFIKDIAREAGALTLKRFKGASVKYYKSKSRSDAVTATDLVSEKLIISHIKKRYPTHGIIAEESGRTNADAEYVWIIDPIDGTHNFASGIPVFGVMVALAYRKKIVLAAVYMPITNELVFAKSGKGAFINGKRVRTSQTTNLLVSHGIVAASMKNLKTPVFLRQLYSKIDGGHAMIHAWAVRLQHADTSPMEPATGRYQALASSTITPHSRSFSRKLAAKSPASMESRGRWRASVSSRQILDYTRSLCRLFEKRYVTHTDGSP